MWGVAIERFDVKHAKCLIDIVRSHRCSPGVAHKPGGFLVFVSVTIIPGLFGVLAAPTSTTWCILYSTSLARADATVSGKPVMFRDSAISCGVHDQYTLLAQHGNGAHTNRLWFVNSGSLASQASRFHRFAHPRTACRESERSGDRRVGVERQRSKVDHLEARERNSLFFEMAPTALVKKKASSKPGSKPAEKKKPQPPAEPVEVLDSDGEDEDSEDESESDEEDGGVDEVGFEKLIKALGDDGLNDYDQAHLIVLAGDEEDDKESEEDEDVEEDEELGEVPGSEEGEEVLDDGAEEGGSGSGSGSEVEVGESSGDEDVLALDELEDVELHPDAVPRRGVKVIDNKVRAAQI